MAHRLTVGLSWITTAAFVAALLFFQVPPITAAIVTILAIAGSAAAMSATLTRAWRSKLLVTALTDRVPPQQLKNIRHLGEPSEFPLTFAVFSYASLVEIAEQFIPRECLATDAELADLVRRAVIGSQGIVVNEGPTQILAVFGFDLARGIVLSSGAEQAIATGLALQETFLQRAATSSSPVAMTIGIDTSPAVIGLANLSGSLQVRVIGAGANYAELLQRGCEPFRIMVSPTTAAESKAFGSGDIRIHRKITDVTRGPDPLLAMEIDPSAHDPQKTATALQQFNKIRGVERLDHRWAVPGEVSISVRSKTFGNGFLLNYSTKGIAVVLPEYLGKNLNVSFELELPASIDGNNLRTVNADIRWSRPFRNRQYLHGLYIRDLSAGASESLLRDLHLCCGRLELLQLTESA